MQNFVALGFTARYRGVSKDFPIQVQVKLVTPRGWAKFDPSAIIWALLVKAHQIKLHVKFSNPRPHGYIQAEF